MRGKIAAVALGLASALALAGCAGDTPETTTTDNATESASAPVDGNTEIRVWIVGGDTPDAAREYLKETFEAENPGTTLTIEEQAWTGLVDKYMTALSGSDAPDVVEVGNTQATTFTVAGAFLDLTDKYEELGGDDMLQGFVQAGSLDGAFYAAPYYAGARVVTYSTDIFTGEVPTTWADYLAAAKAATTDTRSGLYMPGKDWRDMMQFVWVNGGDFATQAADGSWEAGFSTPEAIKGLTEFQDMFATANHFPSDAVEGDQQIPFCEGNINFLPAPSWVSGSIQAAPDAKVPGCSDTFGAEGKIHQFAAPGLTAGTYAPVLAGGSNIAIPMRSANPDLAYKALQIMLSDGYQQFLAEAGLVPALVSQASMMVPGEFTEAAANAASVGKMTPSSANWAAVEAGMYLEDAFSKIAAGDDVATVAAALDAQINDTLNG